VYTANSLTLKALLLECIDQTGEIETDSKDGPDTFPYVLKPSSSLWHLLLFVFVMGGGGQAKSFIFLFRFLHINLGIKEIML